MFESEQYLRNIGDKDCLQLNDLQLSVPQTSHSRVPFFETSTLRLQPSKIEAEGRWGAIQLIAYFSALLDRRKLDDLPATSLEDDNPIPRKRTRLSTRSSEYVRQMSKSSAPGKICATQILVFICAHGDLEMEDYGMIIESLISNAADDNGEVSSWAFVALAW